jgi:hypothetical protein
VGAVRSTNCEQARGQIALAVLGRLPENERLSLESHLDGCEECSAELKSLSGLESALSAAEPDRIDHRSEVPETLRASVLASLGTEAAKQRRSTRIRFATAAAVVLLALGTVGGLVAGLGGSSHHPPAGRTFALSGPGTAHVTIQLVSETWGTSVQLTASGQKGGQMLTVSMRTEDGSWWEAGTYTTVSDGHVEVTMGCALPESSIEAVRVTNANGQQVLSSSTYS